MGRWAWPGALPPGGMAAARAAARAAGLVLLYYGFSIGITFYNKWLMQVGGAPGRARGGSVARPPAHRVASLPRRASPSRCS